MCDNFCLWNREMLTEKDFYDYFAEETISIGFVSTQKPEEPITLMKINNCSYNPSCQWVVSNVLVIIIKLSIE
ncbi:hypothetical protein [Microcystis aeruginosa]|uniref:hypothetical protein n=1 Tax=Microcystis aeruginosa TaxID=1126 RepID=UPI001030CABC|nr:hypothetical protein [Microcystis aeruginosa]